MTQPSKAKAAKTIFQCSECGAASPRWLGKCPGCGGWNTLAEERAAPRSSGKVVPAAEAARAVPIAEVRAEDARRITTGIEELDRALGGGLVAGGVVLLGGDPGIGKSTLLMQALGAIAGRGQDVLYASGEESASQIAMRAERLFAKSKAASANMRVLATTQLEDIEHAIEHSEPTVVVLDSVQTVRTTDLESVAGSVSQVREVAARLVEVAKRRGIALVLVGHVTKDGALAGPKVLEHLVDTVLAFEGDRTHAFRLVRSVKNRFGPAHEVGVFEMVSEGLREVPDPSALFLRERPERAAGSLVVPTAESTRPMLVEVQVLVAPAVYGSSRRVASGVDANRLAILLAVLDRRAGIHVLDHDVFASIAGGARVEERATDLALAIAVVSSLRDRAVATDLAVFGELGLAGEARGVPRSGPRIGEARKLGFKRVILPRSNAERLDPSEREGVTLIAVATLGEALEAAID